MPILDAGKRRDGATVLSLGILTFGVLIGIVAAFFIIWLAFSEDMSFAYSAIQFDGGNVSASWGAAPNSIVLLLFFHFFTHFFQLLWNELTIIEQNAYQMIIG